jgi:protein-L-isoaspartate(D-aspartate) O-methyltransferase
MASLTAGVLGAQEESGEVLLSRIIEKHFIDRSMSEAVRKVPRKLFFPEQMRMFTTEDRALPDHDAGIVPAPSSIILILQHLGTGPGSRLLIIGRGGGYAAALAAASGAEVTLLEESTAADRYREIISGLSLAASVIEGSWNDEEIRIILAGTERPYDAVFIHAEVGKVPVEISGLIGPGGKGAFPIAGAGGMQNCIMYKGTEEGFSLDHIAGTAFERLKSPWGLFGP